MNGVERTETIVIGAGQAGLSVGYHLRQRGRPFLILEGSERVGDAWRNRWDSLRLFTPARYDGLDGMPFPARPLYFPTKDEMGDYLESYARSFELPVRTGTRVERVARAGDRFRVTSGERVFEADNVVVAMANFQRPWRPDFADELAPGIVQLHSKEYRGPGQLQPGPVLVVGAGNSGAEIGIEVARTHQTWVSGRHTGEIPFDIAGLSGRIFMPLVLRVLFHRVLTVRTPVGRKARPKIVREGGPLIRTRRKTMAAAGIERVPRVAGVHDGLPLLDDGRTLDVANVIWCTGFRPDLSWIDLPIEKGGPEPKHESGVVPEVPGLYFVGLHFLHALSSVMIHGVGRDAGRIAGVIARRAGERAEASGASSTAAAA